MGHAVVVSVDFDVVVDAAGGNLPLGILVGLVRQGQSIGPIEQNKELTARLLELAQRSVIQTVEQFSDGAIEIGQGENLRWRKTARIQRLAMSTRSRAWPCPWDERAGLV